MNILLPYRSLIPSVRLCGFAQLSLLAQQGKIAFQAVHEEALTPELCGWADMVWLIRSDSMQLARLAEAWKKHGKYLVYVLDDDLLNVPAAFSSGAFYQDPEVRESIKTMLRVCDCFASPSEKLLQTYGRPANRTIRLEEPALALPPCKHKDLPSLKIGFAGSVDRGGDIDVLLGETVERLTAEYGDKVRFVFFGAHPLAADRPGAEWYPYCDSYEEYQERMLQLSWDIALAPMPDTPFHACKHYNKFIEYAGYGIPAIYSDVTPYRGVVADGVTGLLCQNSPTAWYDAIKRLIDDATLRDEISVNCRAFAEAHFSLERVSEELLDFLDTMIMPETNRAPLHEVRWIQAQVRWRRYCSAIKRHGLSTPIVAIKKLIDRL